ncbi:hypothetical protein GCM10022226_20040 [Sphaerisporangium flaviroseum]|uniref:Uncharacterized protein n=1 Tax=Sphaerisporangium flaviroseum TaxID=509199 RepID=A0ABP7HQF2_9ACTN
MVVKRAEKHRHDDRPLRLPDTDMSPLRYPATAVTVPYRRGRLPSARISYGGRQPYPGGVMT